MKVNPLANHILVKPIEKKEENKGGIIVPDTVQGAKILGIVAAVGPGKLKKDGSTQKMLCKVGDTIVYKYSGSKITIEDTEYLMLTEDDVFGIVEN